MSERLHGEVHPDRHKCGKKGEINYGLIEDGTIFCRVCGRLWNLTEFGWVPDPRPPSPANNDAKRKQYWAKKNKR